MTLLWGACIVGAYLVGSIPFGLLIARSHGIDIRARGSGNIGATNVGRVLGKRYGLLCFALDCLKGVLPVIAAGLITGVLLQPAQDIAAADIWWWLGVAIAAVLGHMFPLYVGFRGGKGVATGFGALAAMWPLLTLPALAALLIWFVVLKTTRYMAVASMIGACSLPISCTVLLLVRSGNTADTHAQLVPLLTATVTLALLVIWRHRSNIARLMRGAEPKMGTPAGPAEESDVPHHQ